MAGVLLGTALSECAGVSIANDFGHIKLEEIPEVSGEYRFCLVRDVFEVYLLMLYTKVLFD